MFRYGWKLFIVSNFNYFYMLFYTIVGNVKYLIDDTSEVLVGEK